MVLDDDDAAALGNDGARLEARQLLSLVSQVASLVSRVWLVVVSFLLRLLDVVSFGIPSPSISQLQFFTPRMHLSLVEVS